MIYILKILKCYNQCMNEYNIINTINNLLYSSYIGDDCAYLKDLNIVVSQDNFVEDIHFKRNWYSPYQLGYKSTAVNISDILASGARPKYITIGLTIPNNLNNSFITDFYSGVKAALHGAEIIGGDITGSSNKIFISITAIGDTNNCNISSRKNAKIGYSVYVKGLHGESAAGLKELQSNGTNLNLIKAHIEPSLEFEFSQKISHLVKEPYAMMDTSDGLADALYKIAEASNVKIIVDYEKIPHTNLVTEEQVLFGGEDYKLVVCVPNMYKDSLSDAKLIGEVYEYDGTRLQISDKKYSSYNELNVYNHFGGNNRE